MYVFMYWWVYSWVYIGISIPWELTPELMQIKDVLQFSELLTSPTVSDITFHFAVFSTFFFPNFPPSHSCSSSVSSPFFLSYSSFPNLLFPLSHSLLFHPLSFFHSFSFISTLPFPLFPSHSAAFTVPCLRTDHLIDGGHLKKLFDRGLTWYAIIKWFIQL